VEGKVYKYQSAEIAPEWKDKENGKKFEWVLLGVALTNRPVVTNLEPVGTKLSMDPEATLELLDRIQQLKEKSELKGELKNELEELQEKIANELGLTLQKEQSSEKELETQGIPSEPQKSEKNEIEEALKQQESRIKELESQLRREKIARKVEALCLSETNPDGKVLPKMKETLIRLYESTNDESAKLIDDFIRELPSVNLFGELGSDLTMEMSVTDEIDKKAMKLSQERNISYADAVRVLLADPKYEKSYQEETQKSISLSEQSMFISNNSTD